MARPAIHLHAPGVQNPSAIPHDCPSCGTEIPGALPVCLQCRPCLPGPLRDILTAAWNEGRGRDSAGYAAALAALRDALTKGRRS
jgi:hypothetical protein